MTECDYPPINCYCDEDYECHICVGRGLERDRIVAWLRTYPQTCDCGYSDCTFTSTMTCDELADALERGEHE